MKTIQMAIGCSAVMLATSAACGVETGGAEDAANYPKEAIQLVVPFGAGGATDILARQLANGLEDDLGESVVVINQPGGSGSVAAANVAKKTPDGYTLLLGTSTTFSTTPLLQNVPYKTSDFTGLGGIADQPYMVVTGKQSGTESVESLRRAQGILKYAIAGVGNNAHLSVADLLDGAGAKGTAVPFNSAQEAVTAVLGGQVDLAPVDVSVAAPQVASGRLVPLAVTSSERLDEFPDVPSTRELTWAHTEPLLGRYAVVAPAGLDPDIEKRLKEAVSNAVQSSGFSAFRAKGNLLQPEYADGDKWLTEMIPQNQATARRIMIKLGLIDA